MKINFLLFLEEVKTANTVVRLIINLFLREKRDIFLFLVVQFWACFYNKKHVRYKEWHIKIKLTQ